MTVQLKSMSIQTARLVIATTALLCCTSPDIAAEPGIPDALLTVAERSDFTETSRSDEVKGLVDRFAAMAAHVRVYEIGRTNEDRPILAAEVDSHWAAGNKGNNGADDRLTILLLGNIHSGECAGKEALLMLLRDLTLDHKHRWLDDFRIIFVPNYSADANERMGALHRPGQIGPNTMGLRENAQGLDLNRDFVKLEAPETRALVKLIDQRNPHLFIDTHTTNGSRHRYALTYDVPHNPAAPQPQIDFLRGQLLPEVTGRLAEDKIDTFYYGNLNGDHSRWTTFGHQPRYSTEYVGLRGRLAILSEAYSYVTYRDRIEATKAFVSECLNYAAEHRDTIRTLLADQADSIAHAGSRPVVGDRISMSAKVEKFDTQVAIKGYKATTADQEPSRKAKNHKVDFFGKFVSTRIVDRPFAYVLPFEESRVADRLRMHGVRIEQLTEAIETEVEVYRARKVERASKLFQSHALVDSQVESRLETRRLAAQSYVIPMNQPLGNLIAYLLEPTSDDGLTTWNFFDRTWRTGADFPIVRIRGPVKLPTMVCADIEPAQKLDLDRIHGSVGRVSFDNPFTFACATSFSVK